MPSKTVVIIGGGPAGLTAAYELALRGAAQPIIFEATGDIGGISKTINYKGNRMDIGGHRFFSKSETVMRWWLDLFPLRAQLPENSLFYKYQNEGMEAAAASDSDEVFHVVPRISRIYYGGKLFDYPLSISPDTVRKLGVGRTARIGISYVRSRFQPISPERHLEDFFINRFGRELYATFFKDYTEKVWGKPCAEIDASWGAQRIKGLSISKAILSALKKQLPAPFVSEAQEETSLIEQFIYPTYGPGQLWEKVAERSQACGAKLHTHQLVRHIHTEQDRVTAVTVENTQTGETQRVACDAVFSTMPVKSLIKGLTPQPPENVQEVAHGLPYRDFLVVGLLLDRFRLTESGSASNNIIPDCWIYIQEPGVHMGRLQIYNNWGDHMLADPSKVWIGVEYFCSVGDELWDMEDDDLQTLAAKELESIGIIDQEAVFDGVVTRMPKAYPAYMGTYNRFEEIRAFTDRIQNLFLIGRNGMHQYNNMDHSMLSAMTAVDLFEKNDPDKTQIWNVNAEQEYHEK